MSVTLTDAEIEALIAEAKPLPADYEIRLRLKPKRGHSEQELTVKGSEGSEFLVILRQSRVNPLDFSAILAVRMPRSNQVFRLRRYNGRSHEHTNSLEGDTFYDYHVHYATERYQAAGHREDTYAQPTGRYSDLGGARDCLFADCGFELPTGAPPRLFGNES